MRAKKVRPAGDTPGMRWAEDGDDAHFVKAPKKARGKAAPKMKRKAKRKTRR